MDNRRPKAFLALYFILYVGTNMIHPITPALFQSLGFHDSMFGIAFACMAFTNFLTAPFWGMFSQKRGYIRAFSLGTAGYAIGQLLFGLAKTEVTAALARAFAGLFASSFSIAGMLYITHAVDAADRGRYISYFIAITTVASTMGYLAGGLVGTISFGLTFALQVAICLAVAIAAFILFKEINDPEDMRGGIDFKKVNPLSAFMDVRAILTPALAVFFVVTVASVFATTCFDNSFNYYIRDQFGFPTSYNGIIKAAVGLIGLAANLLINTRLARHGHGRKSIIYVFFIGTAILVMLPLAQSIPLFIAIAICYYTANAVYQPIQQELGSGGGDGIIYGAYTAMRGIGMVLGSLLAGLIYSAGAKLPFWMAAGAFLLSAVLSIVNKRQYEKAEK
ncbi:MAG: MFS transporter [Clostridiaceae bacterium]|nr:MFS transporter [Clostridiaceae bacterium]